MPKKRILCALFALIMCAACALPAFADPSDTAPEEAVTELTPIPVDPEPKEKVWADFDTANGGWDSSDLSVPMKIVSEPERGNVAVLEVNRYYQDGWRGFLQNFSPAIDLFYYRELSFSCFVSPIEDENAKYLARLVIREETGETELLTEITAGEWNELTFDISGLSHRHEISNIEISFCAESDLGANTLEKIALDDITLGAHMYEAMIDRYMGEAFTAYGAEFDYSEDGYFSLEVTAHAPTLEFDMFVRDSEEKNAVLFILDTPEECKTLTLYYSDEDDGFSLERSVSQKAEPGKDHYVFPLPDGVTPDRIKLLFDTASSGRIDVFCAAMVSVFSPELDTFGAINVCEISSDKLSLTVKGIVEYNTALKYAGKKLELYELETYENADSVKEKEPIAEADMSSRFEFYVPISSAPSASVRYAVCIKDGTPEPVFIDYPKYITNYELFAQSKTSYIPTSKKGIQTPSVADVRSVGAEQAVIDVYIDKIITEKSTGYLHTTGNAYYYYDMDYINSLDLAVKQYHNIGTAVYLRLLMQDDTGGLVALRTSSQESATRTAAAVDFLSSHYNSADNGRIAGFIIGKKIDLAQEFNDFGKMSLSDYVAEYVRTLRLVYNSARLNNSSLRVAVPFSDSFFGEDFSDGALFGAAYDKKLLISGLCEALSLGGKLDWLIMWESEEFFTDERNDKICASNYYILDRYLDECAGKHTETPDSVLFFFEPEAKYDADTLAAIYSYSYYTFLFEDSVDGFFIKINDADLLSGVRSTLKYIDTKKGAELTAPLLSYFDATSWEELVAGFSQDLLSVIDISETELPTEPQRDLIGSAQIWNFSSAHSLLGWQKGCGVRSAAYMREGEDAFLSASFDKGTDGSVIYTYDTPEDLSLFDHLSFDIQINDSTYENTEVCIILGGNGFISESSATVVNSEKTRLYLDLSHLPEGAGVRYIEVLVKAPGETCELRLFEVSGHSSELDGKSLSLALASPKNISEPPRFNSMWIVIIATVAIASIAAVIMLARKEKE